MKNKEQNHKKSSFSPGLADNYALMTYEGKPLPKWLHKPVYELEPQEKRDEIPGWLLEPVRLQ